MSRLNSRSVRLGLLSLALSVAPACSSSAGGVRDGRSLGARLADRVSYRPVYPEANPVPRTRALFLSGYAGARYGPAQAGRPVYPTSYETVASPWLEFFHRPR